MPSSDVSPAAVSQFNAIYSGISVLFPTTPPTTQNVCSVVLLPAVSPTQVSLLLMSPSVTCRCVSVAVLPMTWNMNAPSAQVNPAKYKGLVSGLKTIVAEEGSKGLWKGVGPTFVGYSLQGLFKYGLYEVFKDTYMNLAGEENTDKYKGAIWLAGSASAEVFADIALCPLEMTKVKIQTSPAGTFPVPMGAALAQMSKMRAETRYPFGSIVPLWSRQVRRNVRFRTDACASDTASYYL